MEATSGRGASGWISRSEIRSVLKHANASAGLPTLTINTALQSAEESDRRLPAYLRPHYAGGEGHGKGGASLIFNAPGTLLNTRQVAGMLLRLSTSSPQISALFDRFATDGQMDLTGWLQFVSTEQV